MTQSLKDVIFCSEVRKYGTRESWGQKNKTTIINCKPGHWRWEDDYYLSDFTANVFPFPLFFFCAPRLENIILRNEKRARRFTITKFIQFPLIGRMSVEAVDDSGGFWLPQLNRNVFTTENIKVFFNSFKKSFCKFSPKFLQMRFAAKLIPRYFFDF